MLGIEEMMEVDWQAEGYFGTDEYHYLLRWLGLERCCSTYQLWHTAFRGLHGRPHSLPLDHGMSQWGQKFQRNNSVKS